MFAFSMKHVDPLMPEIEPGTSSVGIDLPQSRYFNDRIFIYAIKTREIGVLATERGHPSIGRVECRRTGENANEIIKNSNNKKLM